MPILIRYWREAIGVALVGALVVMFLLAKAEGRRADKYRGQLASANALIEQQNEGIRNLKSEGDRMRARVEEARKAGQADMDRAKAQSDKLRNLPRLNCPTPPEVMGADL